MTPIWSPETYRIHEVDPSIKPDLESAINFYAPDARPIITEYINRCIQDGTPWDLELPFITAKGKHIWVCAKGEAEFQDGECMRLFGTFQDITERKKVEKEIKKANRVFAVLSNINQTIVRVKDKQTLFNEACRITVEDGKFLMAWIGMVDEQTNKFIPVASDGYAEEYIKTIDIDLNDPVFGRWTDWSLYKSRCSLFGKRYCQRSRNDSVAG